jgi:hypothetical protein
MLQGGLSWLLDKLCTVYKIEFSAFNILDHSSAPVHKRDLSYLTDF